jgi:hypothetical protein
VGFVKLIAAVLCCAALCAVAFSVSVARRPPPVPRPNGLELCRSGEVELVDERCNAVTCGKRSVRLTWDRGEGVLFEDDSTLRSIREPELSELLASLSALQPVSSDSDLVCGSLGCPPVDRALTITTQCGPNGATFTFMRAQPAWDRVRSDCARTEGTELARCTAERAWHAAFATTLASRFGTVFDQLRESGSGG